MGNPHLGTRVSLRAVARVVSAVQESAEGLSNNNNNTALVKFMDEIMFLLKICVRL